MFNTPVLFLVFNRPGTTVRVFAQIRKIKPAFLYVAADGPRNDKPGEKEICDEVRHLVLSQIDWECEVKTLFREENLGCGLGPAEAITWFFENVEEGIILEDDVLPTQSFFMFAQAMLFKFRDDVNVMHVSGNNFQFSQIGIEDYYLSKLPHSWGWATWKRAWNKFDFNLMDYNENQVKPYFEIPSIDNYWHYIFKLTKEDLYKHVWDYQWVFANMYNNGLSVLPQKNLVSNIGFGSNSTHTSDINDTLSNLKSYEMDFEIRDTKLIYDSAPDIKFHNLFGWEIKATISRAYSWKDVIKILLKKINIISKRN